MGWWKLGSLVASFRSLFHFQAVQGDQLGTYTIKSHGAAVAKNHKHDWIILVLLGIIEVVMLFTIQPFHRFVGKDMMTDLKYPLKENTVPFWAIPMYAVLLPIAIFVLFYARRKDVYDLHHSILGLLFAVLVTAVITDSIKNGVGRPRPDFFWRCFPDGIDLYDDKWGDVVCHGKASVIKEGYKSFPSGHASGSFAGLGFLALYLSGKIKVFDKKGHVAKLCIVALPLLCASLVAVSRVSDYWHHWQDVFAGSLLGFVAAAFCYRQFFPAPYHDEGWGPYAYFRALEETSSNNSSLASASNALSVEVMGVQNGTQPIPAQNGVAFTSNAPNNYTSIKLDELESGRGDHTAS